jgi:hypothetical protein
MDVDRELRGDLRRDHDSINRNFPHGHSQRALRIEDACWGHLDRTAKKYWQDLLEPAPLPPQRRSDLFQRAINEAFQEIGGCARKGGVHQVVESFRDELLKRDLAHLEAGMAEDAIRLTESRPVFAGAHSNIEDQKVAGSGQEIIEGAMNVPLSAQCTESQERLADNFLEAAETAASTPASGGRKVCQPEDPTNNTDAAKLSLESWEDVELTFIGDHEVEVRVGGKVQVLNYKQIEGFENRRDGKPSQLWAMLRLFGQFPDGMMPESARLGKEWECLQKTIGRTSKVLRKHFGMTGDPFPYIRDIRTYHARVKIRFAPGSSL